jgi:hypothetical protein
MARRATLFSLTCTLALPQADPRVLGALAAAVRGGSPMPRTAGAGALPDPARRAVRPLGVRSAAFTLAGTRFHQMDGESDSR